MNNRGFTLIEVIIYITLFSLILGSAFVIAYQLIEGSSKLSTKSTVQAEGNFVLRKLNWALTGLDPDSAPVISGSACSQTLSVDKTDPSVDTVDIRLNEIDGVKYIEIQENEEGFNPITTINVLVSCLKFSPISGTPAGITASFEINGSPFSITKYVRQ